MATQSVLEAVGPKLVGALGRSAPSELPHPVLESRVLVGYVATLSALVLGAQRLLRTRLAKQLRGRIFGPEKPLLNADYVSAGGYVTRHGGPLMLSFQAARFVANAALTVVTLLKYVKDSNIGTEMIAATATYTFILSSNILLTPATQSHRFATHATLSGLAIFFSYLYRDVWPLVTYTLTPADALDPLVLAALALSTVSSVIVPICEPYPYIPYDPAVIQADPSAEQTTSILGFISYAFQDSVISAAYRTGHLEPEMLPPQLDSDDLAALKPSAYPYLSPFYGGGRRRVRVLWGLLSVFRGRWVTQAALLALDAFLQLGAPIGTNQLLAHVEARGAGKLVRPGVWIAWIALAPLAGALVQQMQMYVNQRTLVRLEALLTALVHEHALRVRVVHAPDEVPVAPAQGRLDSRATDTTALSASPAPAKATKTPAGVPERVKSQDIMARLTTLVTADLANISGGGRFLYSFIQTPLSIALASVFLVSVIGSAAWVGFAVMLMLMPVPAWTGKLLKGVQKKAMTATDARVKAVKEALGVLRMVKIMGFESEVQRQIQVLRDEELRYLFWRRIYNLVNICVNYIVPLTHMLVTYAYFTLVQRKALTASIVFSSITGFTMLRGAIWTLVQDLPALVQAYVSIGRMQEFLNDAELLDRYSPKVDIAAVTSTSVGDFGLENMSFTWTDRAASGTLTSGRTAFRLHIEAPLRFASGALNLIIGPTGCGKSSLLLALLGEMHRVPAGPNAWMNVPRDRGIAYCAQESWVQSMSIRENILFGNAYDEARYNKVIYQCGLRRDLELFEGGDSTEVGEKGLTLSGGQKARIALARAVYSNANTVLLDDVLAALDVHTAVWIVNKCLKGDLLRGRTVLMVTHNVALVTPLAASVVSMGSDGRVLAAGSPAETVFRDQALAEQFAHEQAALALEEELEEEILADDPKTRKQGEKLVLAEEVQRGSVGWNALKLYFTSLSRTPILYVAGCFMFAATSEGSSVGQYWWLGTWAHAYEEQSYVNAARYLGLYFAITMITLFTYCFLVIMYTFGSVRSSRVVHTQLMASILASTFRWLDRTPTSRILTRCTEDMQALDGPLAQYSLALLMTSVLAGSRIIAIVVSAPVFLLPSMVIGVIGGLLGRVYMTAQLSVKRARSNAKAPVVAEVNDAFAGLVSIRAFGKEAMFMRSCAGKINEYSRLSIHFQNLNRWISVRIQALASAFAGGLAVYLIYGPGSTTRTASIIGFQLVMAVDFTGMILTIVRVLNEFEVQANSMERIQSYINIEHEPEPKDSGAPPAYWPASGDLRVENLTARYSPDGPIVLDNISFHVKAGERVGVVGRTGSGKSTITLALLRCIFTEGEVYYDSIKTSSINLDALRSNVTIIPQAPELLAGTLRKNLDMFGRHDDVELNAALRSAGLSALQADADENRLTLDSTIAAGGGNLSVGQRQIVALARAIVRSSKLLILDEATSAIDYKTDTIIQESLRTELKRDVTVITVAHRLQTVLDSDKIMVLDAGKIVEFDAPAALLKNDSGLLRALVEESADREELYAMAEGKASA